MWPGIERNNGVGTNFEEKFWDYWGPTKMFYFNPEIFDDNKKIKSIYCMYLPFSEIKFNENEIAMGLHYECGDFGQHTVLFSYEEIPNIEHNKIWDYCVFENLDTDLQNYIDLHNYKVLEKRGEMTETEVYQNFLEDYIVQDCIDKNLFRILSENIVKAYLNMNPTISYNEAYIKFLENLCQRISKQSEPYEFIKKIEDCCKEKPEEFDKTILEIIQQTQIDKSESNIMRKRYKKTLEILEEMNCENDLNSIFQNCRELFLQDVVKYDIVEQESVDYDFEKKAFVKTGEKIKVHIPSYGILVKDENQKAVFQEKPKEYDFTDADDEFSL